MSIEAMKRLVAAIDALPEGLEGHFDDAFAEALDKAHQAIAEAEKHDAYYYADTGEWVEPRCADMACLFCEDRPAKADQEGKLMNEQEPWVILTSPKRIWLDIGFDPFEGDDIPFIELADVTWSADNATGYGIEYVRADVPQRQWVRLTEQERNDIEDCCKIIVGKDAFDAIEAKLKEKNR